MGSGAKNRRIGHNAERYYANKFREIGTERFKFCITSREGSKQHDDAKIDLINIPFNLQIKAGTQKNLSAGKELFNMECAINMMFPKEDAVFTKPKLLVHYVPLGEGERLRTEEHERLYMSLTQYEKFKVMNPEFQYTSIKEARMEHYTSEYRTIVSMPFEVFKRDIILKHYI